jgi:predicted DNA-binding transcriptional regulator YafY
MAAEFGVSVRTIKRDLAALETSGAPIWSRPGPGGGYGLAGGASLPPISLSSAQAVSLLAAVSAAPDAPYADLARAAVQKILDVLDPRTREQAEQLADRVWVDTSPSPSRAVSSAIEQAMTDQKVVRIRYASSEGTPTTRMVEPVLFGSTNGHWYLIGWCQLRDAMRWFRLDRIQYAVVTSTPCGGHRIDEIGVPPTTARPVHGRRDG